jgi:hypothetical protein
MERSERYGGALPNHKRDATAAAAVGGGGGERASVGSEGA